MSVALLALAAACGGDAGEDLVERHHLRVQATAWENHMPGASLEGSSPPCTSLIVTFTITGNDLPMPPDMAVGSVSLQKDGVTRWSAPTSADETGFDRYNKFVGAARGCRTDAFSEGDSLELVVHARAAAVPFELRTAVKLGYAW